MTSSMGYRKVLRTLAATTSLGLVVLAAPVAQALDLRPGLWEQAMTMQTTGAPPIPADVLAKMPPDQRAKLQAALGGEGGRTTTVQSCITKEQLAEQNKDPFSSLHETGMTCKRDLKANTSTRMEAHLECTGASNMVADSVVEAPNPTTILGSTQMVRTATGNKAPTNIKMTFNGKWLSSDCGDKAEGARPKAK